MLFRRHPVRDEQLNAYLDEQLSAAERARVRAHIDGCMRCRRTLDELRAVRSAVRALPQRPAPRSYALRQADVRSAPPATTSGLTRAMPLLSGVTAAALVAFGVLVGLDVSSQGFDGDTDGTPAVTSQEVAERAPEGDAALEEGLGGPRDRQGGTRGAVEGRDIASGDGKDMQPLPRESVAPGDAGTPANLAPNAPAQEAVAPTPTRIPAGEAADKEDDRAPWRAAQAATAAVALLGAASLAFVWRRRRA